MGNRDVPEWLLAEVATLSRIVSLPVAHNNLP